MAEARAFWVTAAGRGELRDERLPPPRDDEVLVEARASGISRGTECLVFTGRVPPNQHETMRAPFQAGEFGFPVKYGYSSVGVVAGGAEGWRGRRVFCLHPHQDRYVVPTTAVRPVPDAVPDSRAVLAANLETALNGLWDARPLIGDRIAVIGVGVVGALVAYLAAGIPGTAVELIDVDVGKARIARDLGLAFAIPDAATADADLVVHTSGTSSGLATALRLAGFEATVLELSWYGGEPVTAPLGEAFHSRRLTIRSSQVGTVAAPKRGRWSHARRLDLALRLLDDDRLDALLEPPIAFDRLPGAMARLAETPGEVMCQIVTYP